MGILFIGVIYLAFIGMGLYTPLLGAVWPVAHVEFGVPVPYSSFVSTGVLLCTLLGVYIAKGLSAKIGKGQTVFFAMLLMCVACFGFSVSPSFYWMILCSLPMGCSIGLLDMSVNNYIALNFKPMFMSWLHCAWGLGGLIGPVIASVFLKSGNWRMAYRIVAVIQLVITVLVLLVVPLWKKFEIRPDLPIPKGTSQPKINPFLIPGVFGSLVIFFFTAGIESSANHWGSTFLGRIYEIAPNQAARWVALFFAGMTVSRFIAGIISIRVRYQTIIVASEVLVVISALMLLFPPSDLFLMLGFGLFGVGCGPVIPGLLHLTPEQFGAERSQQIMSMEMTATYAGSMILAPMVGQFGTLFSMKLLPIIMLLGGVVLLTLTQYGKRIQTKA